MYKSFIVKGQRLGCHHAFNLVLLQDSRQRKTVGERVKGHFRIFCCIVVEPCFCQVQQFHSGCRHRETEPSEEFFIVRWNSHVDFGRNRNDSPVCKKEFLKRRVHVVCKLCNAGRCGQIRCQPLIGNRGKEGKVGHDIYVRGCIVGNHVLNKLFLCRRIFIPDKLQVDFRMLRQKRLIIIAPACGLIHGQLTGL